MIAHAYGESIDPFVGNTWYRLGLGSGLLRALSEVVMPIQIDLTGKVSLITGSSQGIGEAIARRLHEAGSLVILNHPGLDGGKTESDCGTIATELNLRSPDSAWVEAGNVADPDSVLRMIERVSTRLGGIDILVNNAGILRDRSIAKMSLDEWNAVINVNLSGVFHCCKFGLEILRDGGSIVNMGSLAAYVGFYGQSNYAAAKAGVHALTKVLSRECARRSIRVNAVAPGVVETLLALQIAESVRTEMIKSIPWGRFAKPSEIADVVLFLASDLASYVTGQTIEVNGGWHAS